MGFWFLGDDSYFLFGTKGGGVSQSRSFSTQWVFHTNYCTNFGTFSLSFPIYTPPPPPPSSTDWVPPFLLLIHLEKQPVTFHMAKPNEMWISSFESFVNRCWGCSFCAKRTFRFLLSTSSFSTALWSSFKHLLISLNMDGKSFKDAI